MTENLVETAKNKSSIILLGLIVLLCYLSILSASFKQ